MRIHWLSIVLAAAALGCETTSSTSEPPAAPLDVPTGPWGLAAFELVGGQVIPVTDSEAYTLELIDEERLHVRADCNVCSGGYTLAGHAFRVGLLACTLVACPEGSLERRYLRALESASGLELDGDSLRVVYDEGVLRFVTI